MHRLSSDFRRHLGAVTDRTSADLATGWRNFEDPRDTRDWLTEFLLALTDRYGLAAASLAADYYELLRDDLGARKRFSAVTAEPPNVDQVAALARFSVGSLFGASPDPKASLSLAQGGSQRLVANTARQTITLSSTRDPSARGWQRVGVGDCDFCQMLLGRGAVYTEATADFQAHDRCGCSAEPVFS